MRFINLNSALIILYLPILVYFSCAIANPANLQKNANETRYINDKSRLRLNIVAAENTYGEVANELGGPYVSVTNILSNPSADPHLFTTTPSTAKAVTDADIVIYNGADYDPWITSLLTLKSNKSRVVIDVAALVNVKPGENPHIWYAPTTMPIFAKTLVAALVKADREHQQFYEHQLDQFNHSYEVIFATIKRMQQAYANVAVIATEPVFGDMAKSIGLIMHGEGFQNDMMNDVPPSVSAIKSFEDDIAHHAVRLLIYNDQVVNPLTKHMLSLADQEKIPVVGVSEMIPPGMTYIQWIMLELNALNHALATNPRSQHG